MEITQNFYNAYCTQKYFSVEKYFERWDPKIHGPRNYLRSFYVGYLIDECGTKKHYPLEMFRNSISKKARSSYKGTTNNGNFLSKQHPRKRKIAIPRLKKIICIVIILKPRMMHFLRIGQKDLPF